MRGLRSTIFLLIVLVALGAYLYFVEMKRPASSDVETKEKVFAVDADKIVEVQVKASNGDTTTLKRSGSDWQVAEPQAAKADQSTVSGITSNLSTLEIQRVIEEAPTSLDSYSLTKPLTEVTFRTDADKTPRKLLIGEKTPTGGDVYAMRGDDKRVFLIPAYLEGTFNRNTFDLRDKAVLTFARDKIDSIELTGPAPALRAIKKNTEWQLAEPWPVRADFGALESLIARLETSQMKSIVNENTGPAELQKYGLDRPAASVTMGSGSSRATVQVGGAAGEGMVYARDVSRPVVFTVETAFADELKKPAVEFRRKDLFDFRPFNANRVEIVRNGKAVALGKASGTLKKPSEQWIQVAPERRDVDNAKMETLLSQLSNVRATSFDDAPPRGSEPVAQVVVKYGGSKEDRVAFSKSGTGAFAVRADEPGIARLETSTLEELIKGLDDALSAKPPSPAKD